MDPSRPKGLSLFPEGEFLARREALVIELDRRGIALLIVTDAADMRYLTGFSGTTQLGPNPFTGGLAGAVMVGADGRCSLVIGQPDLALCDGTRATTGIEIAGFPTFESVEPLFPRVALASAIARLARTAPTVGVQPASLPLALAERLFDGGSSRRRRDASDAVAVVRQRKSALEVARIQTAVAACDAAHDAASQTIRDSRRIADIRRAIFAALESFGTPVQALVETSVTSILPSGSPGLLSDGEGLIVDIAPCVNGYWGDSCETYILGDSDPAQRLREARAAAIAALGAAQTMVVTGATAGEVDRSARAEIARRGFPDFDGGAGHGLGVDFHESPRLVPDASTRIQPGMVLAIEPTAQVEGAHVRVEEVVLAGDPECKVLSGHLRHRDGALLDCQPCG